MNRSCNSILCRFGIHTADPYVHIQVKCRNGSHRWQSGLDPRRFYDLVELVKIAQEVLENES